MNNSKCYCIRVLAKVMHVIFVGALTAEAIIGFCFDSVASRSGVAFLIRNTYIPIYSNECVELT